MTKRTVLDQIERAPNGDVRVGYLLQEVDEAGAVVTESKILQGVPSGCSRCWKRVCARTEIEVSQAHAKGISLAPCSTCTEPTLAEDIAWMLEQAGLPDFNRAYEAASACAAGCDGKSVLIVNLNKRLVGRRASFIPGERALSFNVRNREGFLAQFPKAQALHDLVFTPEVIAADEAAKVEEQRVAEELAKKEAEELQRLLAEKKAIFDAEVKAQVEATLASLGITPPVK